VFHFATNYCTAIVTVLELTPPIVITTGTEFPNGDPAGTCALTTYSPVNPATVRRRSRAPESVQWSLSPAEVSAKADLRMPAR
jgi:hypothetical protein